MGFSVCFDACVMIGCCQLELAIDYFLEAVADVRISDAIISAGFSRLALLGFESSELRVVLG